MVLSLTSLKLKGAIGSASTEKEISDFFRRKQIFSRYYSATKSALYGKNGNLHKSFDHRRFAETMKNCPHKWLVTYDDSEYVKDLFSFANVTAWDLTYGMRNVTENSDQRGKELFISNYIET